MLQENQRKEIEALRAGYEKKEVSALDELKRTDRRAKRPAKIFAYVFGIAGALVLGVGMCLAMEIIGNLFVLGIVVGVVGIAMVSVNYFLYQAVLKARKKKYADKILKMSAGLLNE